MESKLPLTRGWKSFFGIAVMFAVAGLLFLWIATRGAPPPTAAEVQVALSQQLRPGDSLETACTVLRSMSAVTTCELNDEQLLIALIRHDQNSWRVVKRSVSVKIYFDPAGGLSRIECRDAYTGP